MNNSLSEDRGPKREDVIASAARQSHELMRLLHFIRNDGMDQLILSDFRLLACNKCQFKAPLLWI